MIKSRKIIAWATALLLAFLTIFIMIESNAFEFVIYTLVVFLNGWYIYESVLKHKIQRRGNSIVYFSTGYLCLIVLYYICCIFRTFLIIKVATAVLAIKSLTELYKFISEHKSNLLTDYIYDNTEKMICILILMCWSAYIMYDTFTTPNMMWNPDYQWHMGNMYTLSSGYNFQDIRVSGMTFKYHYFNDLFFAIGRILFGLLPYDCAVRFPILIVPFLAVESITLLFDNIDSADKRLLPFLGTFSLVFMTLSGSRNDITYQLLSNINSVGISLPCGILCACFIMESTEKTHISIYDTVYSMMLICLVTGLKGPFALSLLGGATGYALYMLIKRIKLSKNYFLYLACMYIAFGITYMSLLSGALNEDYARESLFMESVYKVPQLIPYIDSLGLGLKARFLFFLPASFVFLTGILAIPFVLLCIKYLFRFLDFRNKEVNADVFVICLCVSSVVVYYLFNLAGTSQNYFLYFSTPFIGYLGFKEIVYLYDKIGRKRIFAAVITLLCSINIVVSFKNVDTGDKIDFYTDEIIEGVQWIKENIPDNHKIAVNRHGAFYMLSGFTGKTFNIEGVAYARNSGVTAAELSDEVKENDLLFSSDCKDRYLLAEKLGVNWLVYVLETWEGETESEFTDDMLDFGQGFEISFKNEDIAVIKINNTV